MTDNLPAVRAASAPVVRDTDSWVEVVKDVGYLAESVAPTTFVPEGLRNNIAGTAAAILYGREIGLPPMTTLQTTHVIKGRVGISAEMQRALVLSAGHEIEYREVNAGRCVIAGRRSGSTNWTEVAYSIDDAKTAGLLNNSNYRNNPTDMLIARASTRLCRMLFPDVIRGMASAEELEELDDDPRAAPAPAQRAKVQRKRTTPQTDDGAVPSLPPSGTDSSAAPSSPPLPPLPGEPGYDSVDGIAEQGSSSARGTAVIAGPDSDGILPLTEAEAPAAQSAAVDNRVHASAASEDGDEGPDPASSPSEVRMNTRAQQRGLFALFKGIGIEDDDERMQYTARLIGRMPYADGKPSWNGLTWDEASWMTTAMSTAKTREHVEALIELAEQQRAGGEQG
ncbi:hypothetical protein ABZX12_18495 [Kribbella sp. NPDC003505]|uniref:hypothetical protein n=1 Tax=Kribbella sp. NPDC003505 TaxID=3154448 RepID=UPI0033BF8502